MLDSIQDPHSTALSMIAWVYKDPQGVRRHLDVASPQVQLAVANSHKYGWNSVLMQSFTSDVLTDDAGYPASNSSAPSSIIASSSAQSILHRWTTAADHLLDK